MEGHRARVPTPGETMPGFGNQRQFREAVLPADWLRLRRVLSVHRGAVLAQVRSLSDISASVRSRPWLFQCFRRLCVEKLIAIMQFGQQRPGCFCLTNASAEIHPGCCRPAIPATPAHSGREGDEVFAHPELSPTAALHRIIFSPLGIFVAPDPTAGSIGTGCSIQPATASDVNEPGVGDPRPAWPAANPSPRQSRKSAEKAGRFGRRRHETQ